MPHPKIEAEESSLAEHVSKGDLARILGRTSERSWASLDAAAHGYEDEDGADAIERPALDDIIAVAELMTERNEAFPDSDAELYVVMNKEAAQVPHR
jgi:hypothetical protein